MCDACSGCGKKLEISNDICEKRDIGKQIWLILCDECYKIESEKDSNLELITFIKGKINKLCWKELDIVVSILEKRFENEINNNDNILTEEQWRAFVEKLENVKYDEKLANFYSERKNKYKISKDVKL